MKNKGHKVERVLRQVVKRTLIICDLAESMTSSKVEIQILFN